MLKAIIEDNENDKFAFIYQTEAFLQIVNQQLNFENYDEEEVKSRENKQGFYSSFQGRRMPNPDNAGSYYGGQESKYMRRETSPDASLGFDAIKMQDLQRTNELLLKELRKANDKYFNERLESKKLKTEIDNLTKNLNSLKRQKSIPPKAKGKI